MPESEPQRDLLEVLAEEFVDRRRRGECPSISEYVARYPELADDIRDLFPTIAAVERLKVHKEQSGSGVAGLAGLHLERLGDYRIVREIGRGGMGIVFEAEQESLGRRVAIKVLPRSSLLAPDQVKRFQREARIAAGLHHTNIVSVFGVGQQDGLHYYVMQYIPGMGLDHILAAQSSRHTPCAVRSDETSVRRGSLARRGSPDPAACPTEGLPASDNEVGLKEADGTRSVPATLVRRGSPDPAACPTEGLPASGNEVRPKEADGTRSVPATLPAYATAEYWACAARIGVQAASALDYAHSQGTLHCDVKPANLLLDSQGVVWITDFGVAKAIEFEDLTRTGDVSGTLQYLAPERFQGQTDPRSDLYSLGLTLYELLTLRPAFDEPDRQQMIHRILEGLPVAPRKRNPAIPRDLETIVLKATARDPGHRYPTVAALADDLKRYLEDRPILARRASLAERGWRWCRRNPVVAGLASTVAVLLLVVTVLATAGYFQTRQANVAVRKALDGERQEREKAQATSKLALSVLDRIYTQFAPRRAAGGSELTVEDAEGTEVALPQPPALSQETAALLENLLVFYDRIAAQSGDSRQLRQQAARANRRVADIQAHLGQFQKARATYQRTLARYEELKELGADAADVDRETAAIHNQLGDLNRATMQLPDAYPAYQAALKTLEPLATPSSADETRYELARTYYSLGTLVRRGLGPANRGPGGPAGPRPGHGPRLPLPGPPDGAPGSRALRDRPFPEGPPPKPPRWDDDRPPPKPDWGGPGGGPPPKPDRAPLPPVAPGFDRQAEDVYLTKAAGLLEQLCREHPSVGPYRHLLACCHRDRSRTPADRASSRDGLEEAVRILEQLVNDFPQAPDYRCDLAEAYAMLAHRRPPFDEDSPSAERYLDQALALCEQIRQEYPGDPTYAASLVPTLYMLSEVQRRHGRRSGAEGALRSAVTLQASLVRRSPEVVSYRIWQVLIQNSLAEQLREQRRLEEARALLEDSAKILDSLQANDRDLPHVRRLRSESWGFLADLLEKRGEAEAAAAARRRAGE